MSTKVELAGAVIIISTNPQPLAAFYRDALGIGLEEEKHDDDELHYGCYLGPNHFAIHPPSNFAYAPETAFGSVRVALHTFDLDGLAQRLIDAGVQFLMNPVDLGWCRMMAIRDPDGNAVEILQGSADHLRAMAARYQAASARIARYLEGGRDDNS